jgi:hypothetical protein
MEKKMYVKPRFRKLSDKEFNLFWESLRDAREINEHGNFVLLRDVELYRESQNFMLGNGIAGYAIYEGELISVHKNNKKALESEVRHILPKLCRCAIKNGAMFCDCYGEWLANYYMKSGYIVAAKIEFDKLEDNPDTWEYHKFGKPNVYLLMRGVRNVEELDRLKANGEIQGFDAVESAIKYFPSYEAAEEYRAKLYESVKRFGYKKRLEAVKNAK